MSTTLSLEGSGATIQFLGCGFSSDLLGLVLSDKAREAIETTHLGTAVAKTYRPGETQDLGTIEAVFDHNPEAINLVGRPPEQIIIRYPDTELMQYDPIVLWGFAVQQGGEKMWPDNRMVTAVTIRISPEQITELFVPGPSNPVPVITSSLTSSAVVGTPWTYQITATNAPTSFGAAGLPAWASINTSSGLISGTPTADPLSISWLPGNTATSGTSNIGTSKIYSTILPTSGKYYFELSPSGTNNSQGLLQIGIHDRSASVGASYFGQGLKDYAFQVLYSGGIWKYNNGANSQVAGAAACLSGGRFGIYFDADAGTIGLVDGGGTDRGVIFTGVSFANAELVLSNSSSGAVTSVASTLYVSRSSYFYAGPSGYLPGTGAGSVSFNITAANGSGTSDPATVALTVSMPAVQVLINGGFESAVGSEWTLTNCARSDGTGLSPLVPRTGAFLLRGMQAASCSAIQVVSCSGYTQASFSGYMNNYFANIQDTSRILVEAFASGAWSSVYDTGAVTGSTNTWYPYLSNFGLPVGSTQIRVSLIGARFNGTDLDAYWDDISLVLS